MHPVMINDGEVALLKQAREERDWRVLPTAKLLYLYQRLVALPSGDIATVKQIAKEVWRHTGRKSKEEVIAEDEAFTQEARKAFGIND